MQWAIKSAKINHVVSETFIKTTMLIMPFLLWTLVEWFLLYTAFFNPSDYVPESINMLLTGWLSSLVLTLIIGCSGGYWTKQPLYRWFGQLLIGQFVCSAISYISLILGMWLYGDSAHLLGSFSDWINIFLPSYLKYYAIISAFNMVLLLILYQKSKQHKEYREQIISGLVKLIIVTPVFWLIIPSVLDIGAFKLQHSYMITIFSSQIYTITIAMGAVMQWFCLIFLYFATRSEQGVYGRWLRWIKYAVWGDGLALFLILINCTLILFQLEKMGGDIPAFAKNLLIELLPALIIVMSTTVVLGLVKKIIKSNLLNLAMKDEDTSGQFGTAQWANKNDIDKADLLKKDNGILSGIDSLGRPIYLPLANKLTISPQGGGKTVSSSIPVLLSHQGPVFVFDVKGELWATTAKHRFQNMKRKIITIDPFKLRQLPEFAENKPPELLKHYCCNPFDWLPEDRNVLDRMINNFAASFVINDRGGHSQHFDENARILIRGYIDYITRAFEPAQRGMIPLYNLMCEDPAQAQLTFEQMAQVEGRAAAAANQLLRVGSDERGSILSTSYRQIDWIADSNIQSVISESNFDLRDFIKGDTDIYILLPEDQTTEHNRLVRMLMSLLLNMIVQAPPHELPKQKMLFLLDELAQLGYCPDVEKAIEVMRARGIVVWTVFQTLSQIEMFEKPDLFKGAKIKQIFTNDDVPTMEWIQKLGGKKTVMTKSFSTNKGDSRQKMQWAGGSTSTGEGESVQETGVDLIQINEIRELSADEQFLFVQGARPIKCKKARYFEHEYFTGLYDKNPIETR